MNVAKIYYRMAANRAEGELKDRVLAKLHTTLNADIGASASTDIDPRGVFADLMRKAEQGSMPTGSCVCSIEARTLGFRSQQPPAELVA